MKSHRIYHIKGCAYLNLDAILTIATTSWPNKKGSKENEILNFVVTTHYFKFRSSNKLNWDESIDDYNKKTQELKKKINIM